MRAEIYQIKPQAYTRSFEMWHGQRTPHANYTYCFFPGASIQRETSSTTVSIDRRPFGILIVRKRPIHIVTIDSNSFDVIAIAYTHVFTSWYTCAQARFPLKDRGQLLLDSGDV